jgi:chemotaxis protein CheD
LNIVVNVSDAKASANREDVLVTYSLGSCIAVAAYDPVACCGGLLHYQLPTSTLDAARAQANPCMFADTGMTRLLQALAEIGAQKSRLKVKLAGGADMLNDRGLFSIGKRNHAAIRKILWQHGLLVAAESVGGNEPRTVYFHLNDGTTLIKNNGQSRTL